MKQNNTITHIEIPAPDLMKAIAFYTSVFNWKIEMIAENSYAFFMIGDTNTGGGLDASLKPAPEKCGPQIIVDVNDIEQTLDRIKAAGGSITIEKTRIEGEHGFYAAFQDANGNHLQIHCNQ
ncbi:VOC family protein [Parapedobacter tibetensis]|uniref:VOC family protein n=1 Tax=Parapedobacter tibetensis TaxID=2972951 RepID=UPI00214DAA05|nr:VOC family protein [Parapedobacter tibetensis]